MPVPILVFPSFLYNIVDRIYIGQISGAATDALTGMGLALPIITMISAFANLFGMGGAPLCSIARGAPAYKRAESIMGTSFFMLLCAANRFADLSALWF